jgi:hypothetical protein
MNVAIAYRENDVLSNVNQLKAHQNLHMKLKIAYGENTVLSNVNILLFAMTHYNYLETKMHQPRDDGIVEKWIQMWILQCKNVDQRTIGKVDQQQPTILFVLQEWQSSIAESSCNTTRVGSSFNQQREQCRQISRSDSHVQFGVGIHFARCQS